MWRPLRVCFFVVACGLVLGGAQSALGGFVVSAWPSSESPSDSDLFDVKSGAVVTSHSEMQSPFVAASAFGFVRASGIEPGNAYFSENKPVGFVDFIEIKTASPVLVSGFRLYTYDDSEFTLNPGPFRGLSSVSLSVHNGRGFVQLASGAIGFDYVRTYGSSNILITANFSPTIGDRFRVEFTRSGIFGPRVVEFDAIAGVPEPATMVPWVIGSSCLGLIFKRRGSKKI